MNEQAVVAPSTDRRRPRAHRPPGHRPRILVAAALALLTLVSAAAEAQYFGRNKITYREFDWKIYHSPHFDVYYYEEEEDQLEKVVSFAESAYDRLSRRLDFQIQEPTPLIFYATHSAFEQNNIILNFIPEGVGAFATPARFRMVMPVDLPDAELFDLMMHELTHIFQYHLLFGGNVGRAATARPPTWVMEGMASYLAQDEQTWERMYLRDAVVNDQIPPVSQTDVQGYFAYRFGHAVFDFIEERWGPEGFQDFLYELRNTLGARPGPAIERAFRMEPEDFDAEFRRWLRARYLPQLVDTGEPSDFGRVFRIDNTLFGSQESSGVASPSGDLVASFASLRGELDIVLFDTRSRRLIRNLTKGYTNDYQYLIGQGLTVGRIMGRDLAFSPDGNRIAVFAKRERGRSLLLFDVLQGKLDRVIDMDELGLEQQLSPAFSPDGRTVAFSAWRGGQFDVFLYDLASNTVRNLTDDAFYDGSPTFSPDGRSVVLTSVVGDYQQLFRIDLDEPGVRYDVSRGESNERDAVYGPAGRTLYFTSDRTGAENIFRRDMATGEVTQITDVVTGAFMPTVLPDREDGGELVVYTGYWRGRFDLYETYEVDPVEEVEPTELPREPAPAEDLQPFEADIQVAIDQANVEEYDGFSLFLEDAQALAGVSDDQTYVGQVLLSFSDYLGDRRILAFLSSIESFSNFDITYLDRSRRTQWSVRLYDDRDFFLRRNFVDGRIERDRTIYRETGVVGSVLYPFNVYTRAEAGLGYTFRKFEFPAFFIDPETGQTFPVFVPREDDFPVVQGALVQDTTVFTPWGPSAGRRWRLSASYAPDLEDSGTLTASALLDARQYIPVTQRSNFALRLYGFYSEGNFPSVTYFGGLDTLRGFDFRALAGNRAFYANVEYRFPVIDVLATPLINFQGIRGVVFFDIGGAYFSDFEDFEFYDSDASRLQDGVASYGFGVSVPLLGLNVNWDVARQWDLEESGDFRTSFWIGTRF